VTVHFIGAGPGAADLITVRGRELIRRCPTVLYAGSLVPAEIVGVARRDATVVDTAPMTLAQIITAIVDGQARGDVARVHSGDPALYGAVAEQIRRLRARGIRCQITPGVPAYAAAAAQLAKRPGALRAAQFPEFDAWAAGAQALLARSGLRPARPYLLASVGTATSALLVGRGAGRRVGGTALGGGTLTGLGARLLEGRGFAEIAALAQRGDRSSVDLYISDIYPQLPPGYTAANFGRAARTAAAESAAAASAASDNAPGGASADAAETHAAADAPRPSPADIAHALVAMVGENVSLICSALAAAHPEVRQLVFGGATLRHNPAMRAIIQQITQARGLEALLLEDGEFTGALGALTLAEAEESSTAPNGSIG